MEQKNFLLAIGLIAGFLMIWSTFVIPRFAPPAPTHDAVTASVSDAPAPKPSDLKASPAAIQDTATHEDVVLRGASDEIVFSSKGGAVKSWKMNINGKALDLVLHPEHDVLPLATFPDAPYKITVTGPQAVMTTSLANGIRVTKTLTLSKTGHLHQLVYTFQNPSSRPVELPQWAWGWGPGLGTDPAELKENASNIRAINMGKLKVHALKKDEHPAIGRWAAIDNRYYLVAILPQTEHPIEVQAQGTKEQTRLSLLETTQVPARGLTTHTYEFYAGPKGYTQLKKYDRGLETSVDFGTFASLGRLILNALYWLKSATGNYGIAIILLTIGIQILMVPLTVKSFKATLSMKRLQPRIAEIQARFKGDPKRLNVEMMNVYKTSGTNPFGGCLPMILQLPIFLALFTTLRNAYELRGAPFVGWIHDLASPDVLAQIGSFQLHALPLIMGGAMFVQQRMSGAVSDPTQKQMMTIMPIMFTFMFYGFPSGLVLYWLTNNLMTMAFQYGFQRFQTEPPTVVNTTIVK